MTRTGLEWRRGAPLEWPVLPIKYVADVTLGKMLQPEPSHEHDIAAPYVRAANVQESGLDLDDVRTMWFSARELLGLDLRAGDVLVVEGGASGRSVALKNDLANLAFQNSINRVRAKPGVALGRFIDYVLKSMLDSGQIDLVTNKATINHLTAEKLESLRAAWPPIEEQFNIAGFLDRETAQIDALIEKQQDLIQLLRERRSAVIDSVFARQEGTVQRRLRHLLVSRPSYGVLVPEYVDSTEEGGVPFLRVGDLTSLNRESDLPAIAPRQSDEYARTRLQGGEVLLGVVGKMGQATIAPAWLAGANVARAVAVLRCHSHSEAALLQRWLGTTHFLDQAWLATAGDSIQPTLGMADLSRFTILWPENESLADQAVQYLDRATAKIDTAIAMGEEFIRLSSERRAALITTAVTGRLDPRTGVERLDDMLEGVAS